jgi:hypothetical protein
VESDYGSHFIDGPWDWEDEDQYPTTFKEPKDAAMSYLSDLAAKRDRTGEQVSTAKPVVKTAYTTARIKFSAEVTPGSTISDGYDMASVLETTLKEKFGEWFGSDMQYEVFVQIDVR